MPDNQHLTILTGASRGLGLALAQQILARAEPQHLLCISRRTDPALDELARGRGHRLEAWSQDLADTEAAARRLADWLGQQDRGQHAGATLINNAGVLAPLRSAADTEAAALVQVLRVGLEAPLLLAGAFLRGTRDWPARQRAGVRLLNISSGLGRRGMAGSAAYCAAKAGLDNASRALALEEAGQPWPAARIVSLAPGVIDTDMQAQLRAGDPAEFPEHQRFVDLQRNGTLCSADIAARAILQWLDRGDFGSKVVADVRD